jgi:hypothetical protein
MADEIKGLKSYPDEQILVAGIFGWPLSDQDMATATYKIAPVPNPNVADTAHPMVFDLWPVCYDPNRPAPTSDAYDPYAWGGSAAPGLRLAAFVDEFGENGLKFSICQTEFSASMSQIGAKLAQQISKHCLPASYAQYASCTAHFLVPNSSGGYTGQVDTVLACDTMLSETPCYTLVSDSTLCNVDELLVQVEGGSTLTPGTLLEFRCQ